MLKVGDQLFNAKPSTDNTKDLIANQELLFNIPSSVLNNAEVKLVTPEYFDDSLELTFMTLSQGGAGDIATSTPIPLSIPIHSFADGIKTITDDEGKETLEVTGLDSSGKLVGVEDGAAVRLSVKVAREDISENIKEVKLTGLNTDFGISHTDTPDDTSNVVFLTKNNNGQIVENTFAADYISRSQQNGDNVEYIIDIQGQAKALVDSNSNLLPDTINNYQQAEEFLARNIGIKTSPDEHGDMELTYSITTIDKDNPDNSITNENTQSVDIKLDVRNINDLAFIDQSTIDSTYFEKENRLHKDAVIVDKDKEKDTTFFGGRLTITIASLSGTAVSEEIRFIEGSSYIIDDLKLKRKVEGIEETIGTIPKNNNTGIIFEFNEYDPSTGEPKTTLGIVNNLIKDLRFFADEINEDGTREITLSILDGGGKDESGQSETSITRTLNLFVGQSGTTGNDEIDGLNIVEEALVGGTGEDTLVGGVGDFIDLQLEKEFFDLYSSGSHPDNYYNKVNLGINNSDTSSDLAVIQKALNEQYSQNNPIEINKENSNFENGALTIDLTSFNEINKPEAQVFFVENMNGHIIETNLSEASSSTNNNNNLTIDLLEKAKEILVGLSSDDIKFNKSLKERLGDPLDDNHPELIKIIDYLKSNIFVRSKSNLEDDFIDTGTMNLNGTADIDKLENIENVKGSEDKDHIIGSAGNNILDGRSGDDIIYGGAGDDIISGREGDDIISGGEGNDFIDGGAGNDTIYVSSGSNAENTLAQTIIGGDGDDTLSFQNISNGVLLDFVFGIGTLDEVSEGGVVGGDGIGEVIYFVLEGETYHSFEKIIGSKVNDYIVNLSPWDHFMEIFGGQGNDQIIGSYGNEMLSGGLGNDTLSGGYGVDTLSGGEGFDKFLILDDTPTEDFKKQWVLNNPEDVELLNSDNIFRSEDIIKDFQVGVDTIDLTAISAFNVDLSSNTNNTDISIRNKDDNKFDAVMEIKTEDIDVSITLENFGSVTDESEEAFLSSILV